jgi:hypothetical protein
MWVYRTQWELPKNFTCDHCRLQWVSGGGPSRRPAALPYVGGLMQGSSRLPAARRWLGPRCEYGAGVRGSQLLWGWGAGAVAAMECIFVCASWQERRAPRQWDTVAL